MPVFVHLWMHPGRNVPNNHMPQNYVEVTIPASVDAGELLGLLEHPDSLGSWEDGGFIRLYWPEERWSPAILENLKGVLVLLGAAEAVSGIGIAILPDRNWNSLWCESLRPILIGRRLRVRQSWYEPARDFKGIELIIDPKRAFGTGYHATTQLILEWLEENIHGGERVLDIGTGTGILAMAALRLGASCALGIDNDPDAIDCARENALVNGFGRELSYVQQSFEKADLKDFDVILANLDGNTVFRLISRLKEPSNQGARACLSGLLAEGRTAVAEALRLSGGEATWERRLDEWVAIEVCFREGKRI